MGSSSDSQNNPFNRFGNKRQIVKNDSFDHIEPQLRRLKTGKSEEKLEKVVDVQEENQDLTKSGIKTQVDPKSRAFTFRRTVGAQLQKPLFKIDGNLDQNEPSSFITFMDNSVVEDRGSHVSQLNNRESVTTEYETIRGSLGNGLLPSVQDQEIDNESIYESVQNNDLESENS